MPHTITIERNKLNQSMYQKLKKFIMNKRKREAEERAQDDYYKRLKKEREERKRQTKLYAESLENTKKEIVEARKRIESLKAKRNVLFTRFKQLEQEVTSRDKARRGSLLLGPNTPQNVFGCSFGNDALNLSSISQIGKQMGRFNDLRSSQSTAHDAATDQSRRSSSTSIDVIPPSFVDKQMLAVVYPPQNNHQDVPSNSKKASSSDYPGSTKIAQQQADFNTHELPNLSKCLLGYASATGKLQDAQLLNSANMNVLTAFLLQPKLPGFTWPISTTVGPMIPPNSIGASSSQSQSANLSNSLPPAPTSYRGSITTGQSAQHIQLQQLAQSHIHGAVSQQRHGIDQPSLSVDQHVQPSNSWSQR